MYMYLYICVYICVYMYINMYLATRSVLTVLCNTTSIRGPQIPEPDKLVSRLTRYHNIILLLLILLLLVMLTICISIT